MNENYIKESTKLIRKGYNRKAYQLLEKAKYQSYLDSNQEIEILRRQVYCCNKIIESYLLRNISFYKKNIVLLIAKTKQYLTQWYEILYNQQKLKKTNQKMVKCFLLEMLIYTQHMSLKFYKEEYYHIAYFYCESSKQILNSCQSIKFEIWQYSNRDVWTNIIMGNMLLQNQNYDIAYNYFEEGVQRIQQNIRCIINFKLHNYWLKEKIHNFISRQMIMLFHLFYLLALSYIYSDNILKYYELLKLMFGFHNVQNSEQQKILKDFIKQHFHKVQHYLLEQGEIQKILSRLYEIPKTKITEQINYIDEHFYKKFNIASLNNQSFYKQNFEGKSILLEKSSSIKLKKDSQILIKNNQHMLTYFNNTQHSIYPKQNNQQKQQVIIKSHSDNEDQRKENFSFLEKSQKNQQSMKFLNCQIKQSLKNDSFYVYSDISRDFEREKSQESLDEKIMKTERSLLQYKHNKVQKRKQKQIKMEIFNQIEAKSLYYMEVQKANSHLKGIKQIKDQQQKKNLSDKLMSNIKLNDKQPSLLLSADLGEIKDQKIIFKEVFNDLKELADNYQKYSIKSTSTKQSLNNTIQTMRNISINSTEALSKYRELSKSILIRNLI